MAKQPTPQGLCFTERQRDGHTDICRVSKGHTASDDPREREHYDTGSQASWLDEKAEEA